MFYNINFVSIHGNQISVEKSDLDKRTIYQEIKKKFTVGYVYT